MNYSRLGLSACLLLFFLLPSWAQKGDGYGDLLTGHVRSAKVGETARLKSLVVDGKLRLSLRDAIVLTLENNSAVRIQETQGEFSKFALLGTYQRFDPLLTSSYNITSATTPPFSQLQGTGTAPTVNSTTQFAQFNYAQTFETGTNVQAGLNSNNNYINNSFNIFNPYISSTLNFQFTQPLLRNGWLFANRAPLMIARRNLQQTRANFAAEVNNNVL